MAATPKTEKSATPAIESKAADALKFFNGLAEVPQLNAKMLTRANEIVTEAAKAIWASEVELLRIEAEESAKLISFSTPAGDPAKTAADTYAHWHDGAEKILAQMRGVSDQMRKCGWELFELYSENIKSAGKAAKAD